MLPGGVEEEMTLWRVRRLWDVECALGVERRMRDGMVPLISVGR